MVPIGQSYRPAGTLDVRSILILTIVGVTAAIILAPLFWLWEWGPIPTLILVTPMLQGAAVGLVMAFVVGRLRMRNPRLVGVVAFACGLLSIGLVHYGHYLDMVAVVSEQFRAEIARDRSLPEDERRARLARLNADPAGYKRAAAPFCDECGYWCRRQPDLFTMPGTSATSLIEAVRADHPARVTELRADPPPCDESSLVGVTLHACSGCDQSFADISQRVSKGKETKVTSLLKQQRVSPEMVAAMRAAPPGPEPREEVADDPSKGEIVDEPQSLP
jgi:hypothetical protein